ncbi:MAG: amino acid adenylation domain-containing protein, partial [Moorea sp. SIO3E2]|nr:amino acid adenylation domain-containing protein [Moorena sp. SIO3E2]
RLDLEFHLWLEGEELKGLCAYNRDLFEADTIKRMLSHYQNLLTAILANPEQPISQLPMMSTSEQQQVLVEWNQSTIAYPSNQCIHQLFEAQAEKTPDAVAVIFENQRVTYSELNIRANQLAHYLRQQGVGPDVLVGICVERSLEMVMGLLGILKAGGAYVPLDPNYPQQRLTQVLEDADVQVLLTDFHSQSCLPQTENLLIPLDQNWWKSATDDEAQTHFVNHLTSSNLAYVLYTSGSTGKPKGVAIEHRSAVALLYWARTVFNEDQIAGVLASTSICFDLSVFELFVPLSWGGKVILAENALHLPTLPAANQVRLINTVPSAARALISSDGIPSSVETVNLAGEPLDNKLVQQLYNQTTIQAVYNLYGPSEDTTYSTFALMEKGSSQSPLIGKPIVNSQAYILDNLGQPVPIGVPGELHLGGDGLARCYLNRPELTQEKFIPNPFSQKPAARLYRTGDLARYLPDGNIDFLGRIDYQVKIRGFRIEIGEIEATLNQNSAVKETVVMAREDTPDNKQLVAYIVPKLDAQTLKKPELYELQVSNWENIFDQQIDTEANNLSDPLFNIQGWLNSYDYKPFPETQMRVWANDIVSQVLAHHPQSVWEIGCGTGMLLFQLAPHTQSYYGTDISNASLEHIKQQMYQRPEQYTHVTLAQKRAEDMAGVADDSFDVILLSSIVQYFPSIDYLLEVIENSIRVVKPGGMIFLGDVRSYPLMRAFHTSVQRFRATLSLDIQQLQQRIERSIQQETELLVDPEFFVALKDRYTEITHVQVRLQRGSETNELMKYRYSVLLHIESQSPSNILPVIVNGVAMDAQAIAQYLQQQQPDAVCFKGLLNRRVATDVICVERLSVIKDKLNVQQLEQTLSDSLQETIDPEQLNQLSAGLGYHLELCWSADPRDGCFDAVFVRPEMAAEAILLTPLTQKSIAAGNWHRYGNNPLADQQAKQVIPQLKEYLEQRLPEYMVPNAWIVLSQFPLTPNGKVDRRALPAPDFANHLSTDFVAPRTPTEQALAEIWADVLHLDEVGIHDNFFELGGHSLLATQLISRLRQSLGQEISLAALFDSPTIAQLDQVLAQIPQTGGLSESEPDEPLPMIVPTPDQRYQPFPLTKIQQAYWLGRNSAFELGNISR